MGFSEILSPIERELRETEEVIYEEIKSLPGEVKEATWHLVNSGGKRIRPALLLLCSKAGKHSKKAVRLAAGIEFLHIASLAHDDIIDNSCRRRGRESINSKWGIETAILVGDMCYAKSLKLVASQGDIFVKILSNALHELVEGEVFQRENYFNFDLSEENYLLQVKRKTGSLLSCSCHMGALVADLHEDACKNLGEYGYMLGAAYQILDDVLDFMGNDKIGKPIGNDLSQGIFTLPLIHLLNSSDEKDKWKQKVIQKEFQELKYALLKHKSIQYSKNRASEIVVKAKTYLNILPECCTKDVLSQLADYVLVREY